MTLIEKYGRFRVALVIQEFYEDLLRDPRLGPYFEDVSIPGIVEHQSIFLTTVMGGPDSYTPNDIIDAHSRLEIDDAAFERMIEHLESRLVSNQFDLDDVETITASYRAYQDLVTQG